MRTELFSHLQPLPASLSSDWRDVTGHGIVDCYTTAETGTVLSGPIVPPATVTAESVINGNKDKEEKSGEEQRMMALPGVQTRIVR